MFCNSVIFMTTCSASAKTHSERSSNDYSTNTDTLKNPYPTTESLQQHNLSIILLPFLSSHTHTHTHTHTHVRARQSEQARGQGKNVKGCEKSSENEFRKRQEDLRRRTCSFHKFSPNILWLCNAWELDDDAIVLISARQYRPHVSNKACCETHPFQDADTSLYTARESRRGQSSMCIYPPKSKRIISCEGSSESAVE